jgi:hypothetical protein
MIHHNNYNTNMPFMFIHWVQSSVDLGTNTAVKVKLSMEVINPERNENLW